MELQFEAKRAVSARISARALIISNLGDDGGVSLIRWGSRAYLIFSKWWPDTIIQVLKNIICA